MPSRDPAPVCWHSSDDSAPQSSSSQHPPHLDLFSTSAEDIPSSLPSPPYRRDPSRLNLYLGAYPEESPAYKSTSNVDLYTEMSSMVDKKHEDHHGDSDGEEHLRQSAKTARFEDDLPSPGHSIPPFKRTDSEFDFTRSPRSRSPSIAETDDGEDDYDWDAEEDLVDQEARFEQNMGFRKESWGFRKYVPMFMRGGGSHQSVSVRRTKRSSTPSPVQTSSSLYAEWRFPGFWRSPLGLSLAQHSCLESS